MSGRSSWLREKDGGFTSTGVVVALALTIALLFTSAQVYWTNSTAGDIQFAADAGALAAENVVAEYYVIARVADAVILSISLFGTAVFGIAIVVSCIPYLQSVGVELMNFGEKVFKVRDRCATQAAKALDGLQKALPFLSAANASVVISANGFSPTGQASYQGLAILVPLQGDDTEFADDDAVQNSKDVIKDKNDTTRAATDEAEDVKKERNQAKLDGYLADCGVQPNYCLYERAGWLAGLSGAQNPFFSSVDLWRFDYAFARAKAYYSRRLASETPADGTLSEQVRSAVRKQFFSYAVSEMAKGYAHTDADGTLDAYFPLLARNTVEMRATQMYTSYAYPVDGDGHIHGVAFCPSIQGGITGYGSIANLESGLYSSCSTCGLTVSTVGNVASATTNTNTGFEYHYRLVAQAAERYAQASQKYRDSTREAEDGASDAFDSYKDALAALKVKRLDPKPPGRNGCIVIAFDASSRSIPASLESGFVSGGAKLPSRLAISAAALAKDEASEGNSIITSFLDRAKAQSGSGNSRVPGLGVFDGVLDIWGDALLAYSKGADSLARGLGDFLRSIPLVNATPLASWAEAALRDIIEALGLQGVDLSAPKPVVVNSIHVIRAGDSAALDLIGQAKEAYSSLPGSGSGTVNGALVDGLLVEIGQRGSSLLEDEITLYTISFGDLPGLPQIPIKVKLPQAVVTQGRSLLDSGLDQVRSLLGGGGRGAVWE
ncbi:MAG: hypothetical protein LBU31_02110 [Coriobacteriales bacterium]|nr:hypothetical protein [Coriobacteriales bacterium]